MKTIRSLIFILCLLFALSNNSVQAHISYKDNPHGCAHNKITDEPLLHEVDEEPLNTDRRFLATSTYSKIRITANYDNFIQGDTSFKNYVKTLLLPVVIDYFQAALAVKQPLTSPLKFSTSSTSMCGFSMPKELYSGVTTDFHVMVSSESDPSGNWVASAGSCYLSSANKRPLVAKMIFNLDYTHDPLGDALLHEKNMYLTLHEMMHALGFTYPNFKNFIDANGKTLTNQLKTVTLDGTSRTVLDVEPLTSKLRAHFGCSTLEGAFLEDDGGTGTALMHFERRHFLNEVMTSGVIQGLKVSELSLALLESSGWYVPDYTYADPFFIGKGAGCGFLYTSCNSSSILKYDEFCSGSGRGCAAIGQSGGVCSTDANTDGCRYYIPVLSYHCQNPDATAYARYASKEAYGRSLGSMCFNANLSSLTSSSNTSLCLTYTCSGSGTSTTVQVKFGTTTLTCSKEGPIKVSGYNGNVFCPDPITYCSTVGKKTCPRNCGGRGTCVSGVCQCKTGYIGIDCALNS